MRIGLARALHTFHHYPLWNRFLTDLGHEVVLSRPTDRQLLDTGVMLAPAEACLPVKACLGHMAYLRDKCDALWIPRIVCVRQGPRLRFSCPKSICLPDLVRATVSDLPPVIEFLQDERVCSTRVGYLRLKTVLDGTRKAASALARAGEEQERAEAELHAGAIRCLLPHSRIAERRQPVCGSPRIGVIGHPYLLFDDALSLRLPDKLCQLGAKPLFPAEASTRTAFPEPDHRHEVCWIYEHELLGSAWHFLSEKMVDGLVLVSSFACGTAAITNEVIDRELARSRIPVLTLLLDEQTAEAGLLTRLEAFLELVRRARRPSGVFTPGTPRHQVS